ncbi:hypothetical protein BpHYR1_027947 [Brachionus plicatilis]|uniref:Uncharacterized protein n=1 Tax=Brachionus plicatilis TaxID=10195 RepID=A0A3M7P5E2_BRAPC|nr:hypothetical protein BpHYR1_027947 [Brachionus plicatilis]
MSSFFNKIASQITNSTGSIVGRDNVTRLTNSINQSFYTKSKYRDFLKQGNVVQLLSKSSHRALHICSSPNDPSRMVLLGNGQIGNEFFGAHFTVEVEGSKKHLKFRNGNNYICFDNQIPCVMRETNTSHNVIKARNEFRLHEILGSDEHFALESVFYPGRYLAILPDGSITTTKNRADENTHFCINVITVLPNIPNQSARSSTLVDIRVMPGPSNGLERESTHLMNRNSSYYPTDADKKNFKEQEANYYEQRDISTPIPSIPDPTIPAEDTPPNYGNLFPKLPL